MQIRIGENGDWIKVVPISVRESAATAVDPDAQLLTLWGQIEYKRSNSITIYFGKEDLALLLREAIPAGVADLLDCKTTLHLLQAVLMNKDRGADEGA